MTHIEIDPDIMTVELDGFDQLWAFKREVRVPLPHVWGVAPAHDMARRWWHGLRARGTHFPGGDHRRHLLRPRWPHFVERPPSQRAIAIALHRDRYARLVVEVGDPANEIARVQRACPPPE